MFRFPLLGFANLRSSMFTVRFAVRPAVRGPNLFQIILVLDVNPYLLFSCLPSAYAINTYVLDFFTFRIFCTFFDFLLCFFSFFPRILFTIFFFVVDLFNLP